MNFIKYIGIDVYLFTKLGKSCNNINNSQTWDKFKSLITLYEINIPNKDIQ